MTRQTLEFKSGVTWLAGVCLLTGWGIARAQPIIRAQTPATQAGQAVPQGTALSWAEEAVRNEIQVIESADTVPLRYKQRKVNTKGDTTREVIESRDGNVARLVERNGEPITAKEDAAERSRLTEALASPDDFQKHHNRDSETRDSVIKLVNLMPQAMIYSYAPGQPQPKGAAGLQVVVDFRPNPAFHPPTMVAEALTGLEGRVWIDAQTHYLTRVEARVLHPVNMGFGLVAKIYPGGTMELEQTNVDGHWVYSHLDEHLMTRLLMVKNYPQNTVIDASEFRQMPSLLSYQDCIRMLLAMQISVR
ncbi:MAG: hypothetical protein WB439_11390 [Acidobacteriaceae bacterium]